MVLTALCVVALYLVAGASLGLWLGSVAIAGAVVPAMALRFDDRRRQAVSTAGVVLVIATCWACGSAEVGARSLANCCAVLVGFSGTVWGVSRVLRWMGIGAVPAIGVVTVLGFGWLTGVIWLVPLLGGRGVGLLSELHPLLVMNSQLTPLGIWLEHPVIYRLTTLGQDVPYALPGSCWPAVVLHGGVGVIGVLLPVRQEPRFPGR